MPEPTLDNIKEMQDLLDRANVPPEGRMMHFMDEFGDTYLVYLDTGERVKMEDMPNA